VLGVVDAQRRLRFDSTGALVAEMLNSALDIVRAEHALHEAVAPNRTGTSEWKKKVQLLERALQWLTATQLKQAPRQHSQEDLPSSAPSIAL
jgi:hypothetical protein